MLERYKAQFLADRRIAFLLSLVDFFDGGEVGLIAETAQELHQMSFCNLVLEGWRQQIQLIRAVRSICLAHAILICYVTAFPFGKCLSGECIDFMQLSSTLYDTLQFPFSGHLDPGNDISALLYLRSEMTLIYLMKLSYILRRSLIRVVESL
jgi:hypothetical protein